MFVRNRFLSALLTIVMLFSFLPSSLLNYTAEAKTTPVSANGQLSVKNGKIVNSKGKTFVIKGVSTHGIAWYPEYINKAGFKTLRDKWGVNTIRLALYTNEYGGYCSGGDRKNLEKLVSDGVKYASDLGMYVIIDWHILSDGNPLTYKKEANTFFKKFAKKYKSYNNVLYEICNEPNGSEGSWKNIKSYAKSVIKTIRSVNKKSIIIVGTPTWSQEIDKAQSSPISGYKNIVYSFHFYAGTHKESLRNTLESALKAKMPVIVTEFGITDASGNGNVDKTEGNKWIKLLDKYSVGRVCWNLSNKNESSALIKSSCTKRSGWSTSELSEQGKWLVKIYTGKSTYTPEKTPVDKTKDPKDSKSVTVKTPKKAKLSTELVNNWSDGTYNYYQYKITVKNTGTKKISSWSAKATLSKSFTMESKWCGSFKKDDKTLTIKPLSWNKNLNSGDSTELGIIIKTKYSVKIKSISLSVK